MKYNSIVVQGHKQIEGFLNFLLTYNNEDIPNVRHLLISQVKSKPPPPSTFTFEGLDEKAAYDATHSFEFMESGPAMDMIAKAFPLVVRRIMKETYSCGSFNYDLPQRIISILAPHLVTLTCKSYRPLSYPCGIRLHLEDLHFPLLVELTLDATFGCDWYPRLNKTKVNKLTPFPSLQYFHIAFATAHNARLIPYVLAPALTHFRITGSVGELLKEWSPSEHLYPSGVNPTPKLRNIGILSSRLIKEGWNSDGILNNTDVIPDDLREIVRLVEPAPGRRREFASHVEYYGHDNDMVVYSSRDADQDWLRGVEGIGPYWNEDSKHSGPKVI
ncbi:hypothetical protein NLI96_g9942 [Meripilus lineatus]|uniref:Uncharacterized protein n=1 Tax=Meripilus lineatus TaxID=2056292 RepID=A0AAD5YAJ2_9APHY|nr:hypothetical protein NLI96_g9942 [Physisporinus lineatus]